MAQDIADLPLRQESLELVHDLYQSTRAYAVHEPYGLTQEMCRESFRAVINIYDGTEPQEAQIRASLLRLARGRLCEIMVLVKLSALLGYFEEKERQRLIGRAVGIVAGLDAWIQNLN